jgi:endonuclease/exonuclease/phosphatase family metal-dependent hydrolase
MLHAILGNPLSSLRRRSLVLAATFATIATAGVFPAVADDRNDETVRVMTRNLYFGADLDIVSAATTFPALVAAVGQFVQNLQASNVAERAAAVAREIVRHRVDLIGVQEGTILRTGPLQLPPNPATFVPATTVVSDNIALLLKELDRRGERYEVVAIVPGLDAQLPTLLGADFRLTTRIAILARTGRSSDLKLSNVQVQGFLANRAFPTPGGPVLNPRGWASVDVEKNGRKFRFATTHLERPDPVQALQAHDMIQGAGNTPLPLVFVGDFNVTADDGLDPSFPVYQKFINAGFVEAWPAKRAPDPGFTCCQAPDLLNPTSQVTHRLDLVFLKGDIRIVDIVRVGDKPSDRTASGRWPSDHSGVVATLKIPRAHTH